MHQLIVPYDNMSFCVKLEDTLIQHTLPFFKMKEFRTTNEFPYSMI
jgi:hypothetical protein